MLHLDRRSVLRLAGMGGVVFASGLRGTAKAAADDFFFVQLSDTHWGFAGPPNPEAATTLARAVAAVNALDPQPDFIVFTGDLTHTTDDPQERRRRLTTFREIAGKLKTQDIRYLPGEHDASLDNGEAYREFFGASNYAFDHKGVHFIAVDNVSDPTGAIGPDQLAWLAADLSPRDKDAPIVILTHRPLFDLYPQWDWATRDGAAALDLLAPYRNVTVFYGHIHQEHHHRTGQIEHHAATSLIFPQPAPGSTPKRAPVAWDPAQPFKGLGWRRVATGGSAGYKISEEPIRA